MTIKPSPPGVDRRESEPVPHVSSGESNTTFRCVNLSVTIPPDRCILRGVELRVERGEFVTLLGGSGVGKTTLLRVLGGLHPADKLGSATFDGESIEAVPSGVVMVFQDYGSSLLPWRTVESNVALALESRFATGERARAIHDALSMVGLANCRSDYPNQLSGGMQQRLQIARALVMEPRALLMDEPFGALDALTKEELQDALLNIYAETGMTIVFVTHDIDEAVYLSDRIVVLAGSPATVREVVTIDLGRPRDQMLTKEEPRYLELRHKIYELLHRAHSVE